MPLAFAAVGLGILILVSGLKGKSFADVLKGDTGPSFNPAGGTGLPVTFFQSTGAMSTDTPGSAAGSAEGAVAGSPIPGQKPHTRSTHQTAGLPGYPAFDYMAPPGTTVVSPETGTVTKVSGRDPKYGGPPGGALGYSIYIQGKSGARYFLTHLDNPQVKAGQKVTQGDKIATVADGPRSWSTPHVHMGVNR